MFFPHLMHIKSTDLVLEIGPGAYPFWRSDCLADVFDETSDVDLTQFGGAELNTRGKALFQIVNNTLPFKDASFDYVICSHVFEHVPVADLPKLTSEIMRVGKKAYIEFPRPLYDFIYNFEVHLNLLDIVNNEIVCIDKQRTKISSIKKFQEYALSLRKRDMFSVDEYFASVVAVGKEFSGNISLRIVESENDFIDIISNNKYSIKTPNLSWKVFNKFHPNRIMKSLLGEKSREHFRELELTKK